MSKNGECLRRDGSCLSVGKDAGQTHQDNYTQTHDKEKQLLKLLACKFAHMCVCVCMYVLPSMLGAYVCVDMSVRAWFVCVRVCLRTYVRC